MVEEILRRDMWFPKNHLGATTYVLCAHTTSSSTKDQVLKVKEKLHEFRGKSFVGARLHKDISDPRILSLNFIFPFIIGENERNLCEYIEGIAPEDCEIPPVTITPYAGNLFAALRKLQECNNFAQEPIAQDASIPIMAKTIFNNFFNQLRQWNRSPHMSENQFTEQAVFTMVMPLFEFKPEYLLSKYDKTMDGHSLKPDFLVRLEVLKNQYIDFFVIEVKKPYGNPYAQLESDFVKVHREMKILIDLQVDMRIDYPECYAIFVDGYDIFVFKMTLEYNGEYRSTCIADCRTLWDGKDVLILSRAIDVMDDLNKEIIDPKARILDHMRRRSNGISKKIDFKRPSYSNVIKKSQTSSTL